MSVHGTVLAHRDAIFEQEEGVEKLAGHGHLTGRGMRKIIRGSGLTSSLAEGWIEWQSSEDLNSHIGVVCTVASVWRVDCAVAQILRRVPAGEEHNCIVHISIGTGNDNFEVGLPLSAVVGVLRSNRAPPEHTLDVGRAGRVGAVRTRRFGRISFEVL